MKKLKPQLVKDIYFFTGTAQEITEKFKVSVRVAKRIKYGQTYIDVTYPFGTAGEIKIHKLTWDDVCEIRASDLPSKDLANKFKITKESIYNIKNGKTRKYK